MPDRLIEAHQLQFGFRPSQPILQHLDLRIERGSVYGFLGPNGAGKTTTIRLLLDLLRPQRGEIRLFGLPVRENRVAVFSKIGSLIEQPSLYLHLSGADNLAIARRYTQAPASRVGEVLELVGLSDAARKKAGAYSLGMKQRLGLAMALLHKPELLFLDEPTNGLDPAGIIEMRELIKRLNREWGVTVFVSSHLLAEVERTCTHVGIIHRGEMRFEGSLTELQTLREGKATLLVETSDNARAASLLGETFVVQRLSDSLLSLPYQNRDQAAAVNERLMQHGLAVYQLHTQRSDLEGLFLEITN